MDHYAIQAVALGIVKFLNLLPPGLWRSTLMHWRMVLSNTEIEIQHPKDPKCHIHVITH
jgi:hypothetical protein